MGTRFLILLVALAACRTRSTEYCQKAGINDYAHCPMPDAADAPAAPDGMLACTDDTMCPMERPHCASNECVQCTKSTDCVSGVCLFGGVCQSPDDTWYVDSASTSTTGACTLADPCPTLEEALALTSKPNIHMSGQFTENKKFAINRDVNIFADPGSGTTFTGTMSGDLFTIGAGYIVNVSNIDITCPGGGSGFKMPMAAQLGLSGVQIHGCANQGVLAMAGTVTIAQSKIYGNGKGGILFMGTIKFDITNSMLVQNGAYSADVAGGGAALGNGTGMDRFSFNTVADNKTKTAGEAGLSCPATLLPTGLLLANNTTVNSTTFANSTSTCLPANSRSVNDDLDFINPGSGDYHLAATSTAINAAAADPTITVDFDNQARPNPNGGAYDYGADEFY